MSDASRSGDNNGAAKKETFRGNRSLPELVVTRFPNSPSKQGHSGSVKNMAVNFFPFTRRGENVLHVYEVEFMPPVEDIRLRHKLVRGQGPLFGPMLYDGTIMYLFNKLMAMRFEKTAKDPDTGFECLLDVRHVDTMEMASEKGLKMLNVLLHKVMDCMGLERFRHYFIDIRERFPLSWHSLDVYPCYVASIRQCERNIAMKVDLTHLVFRRETCYQMLNKADERSTESCRDIIREIFIGQTVITTYNGETYRIKDVDFESTPASSFTMADGRTVTFVNYYRFAHHMRIRDPTQPMLVVEASARQKRRGISQLLLVPELCCMIGLTDGLRSSPGLMQHLRKHIQFQPSERFDRLMAFRERLHNTPACAELFRFWRMELDSRMMDVPARTLAPEWISIPAYMGAVRSDNNGTWRAALIGRHMLSTTQLSRWAVVCTSRVALCASVFFIPGLVHVAKKMNFPISLPQYFYVTDDSTVGYEDALVAAITHDPQLVMVIVSNGEPQRYGAIKRKCSVQYGVPSQVIITGNILPRGRAVRTKLTVLRNVAIQLNCKLGGTPWLVHSPLKNVMVVGFVVARDGKHTARAFAGFVAALYTPDKSTPTYFTVVDRVVDEQRLSDDLSGFMVKAMRAYGKACGKDHLPLHVVFYREASHDRQLEYVVKHEVPALKGTLRTLSGEGTRAPPKLTVIVPSRRINTRVFLNIAAVPPVGTVIDDYITFPERMDFYLVSQTARSGTVCPTAYHVVHDESGLTMDQLQLFTFKQTHLYYNWCGTIPVPAVCQYAQKLALLTARHLHVAPSARLDSFLYFL